MDKTCLCRLLYLELQDVARWATGRDAAFAIIHMERKFYEKRS